MRCAIASVVLLTVGLPGTESANAQGSNVGPGNPTVLEAVRELQSPVTALTAMVEELAEKAGTTPAAGIGPTFLEPQAAGGGTIPLVAAARMVRQGSGRRLRIQSDDPVRLR